MPALDEVNIELACMLQERAQGQQGQQGQHEQQTAKGQHKGNKPLANTQARGEIPDAKANVTQLRKFLALVRKCPAEITCCKNRLKGSINSRE